MALSPAIFLDKDGTLRRAVPYDVAPAGIPLRLGYGRENPYPLLTDHVVDAEPHKLLRHEVRRQLDLVASVGGTTDDVRLSYRVAARDRASGAGSSGAVARKDETAQFLLRACKKSPPSMTGTWLPPLPSAAAGMAWSLLVRRTNPFRQRPDQRHGSRPAKETT